MLSRAALAVAIALAGAAPLAAQQGETPAPSPAPTPAPSSVFRLPPADDGRATGVQGPADNGLPPLAPGESRGTSAPTPTPTPTPTPRLSAPLVVPKQPTTSPGRSGTSAPPPAPARRDAAPTSTPRAASDSTDTVSTATSDTASAASAPSTLPTESSASTAAPVSVAATDSAAPATALPAAGGSGTPLWAWLLAGFAAAAAGFWYWRRRPVAATGAAADVPLSPAKPVPRAVQPPPRNVSTPARPAPTPASPSIPAPRATAPASSLVTRPAPERRAQVSMALDIRGIRMTSDQLIVSFTLNLINQGPVAATGLMIRVALNQGSAMTEPVLARFYDGAGGSVLRDDMALAPGEGEQMNTEVMLPRAAVEPLMIGGKPMLVPVIAIDVTYHWDGDGDAFGQNAGSFVLGREQGSSGSEKIAPLPLDHPNLVVNRPAARTTAVRRIQ